MKKYYLIFCICFLSMLSFSQTIDPGESKSATGASGFDLFSKYSSQSLTDKLGKSYPFIPLDGAINASEYFVGPNDIIDIGIWGGLSLTYSVVVSPEGTMVIPTVNEVNVKDLTLDKVKIKIIEELKKKYKSSTFTVTLKTPRQFNVQVTGMGAPLNITATPIDRVDKVVYLATKDIMKKAADGKTDMKFLDEPAKKDETLDVKQFSPAEKTKKERATDFSLRNIKIFRKSGEDVRADLLRYQSTGDTKFNPYLKDGDVVFIPIQIIENNSISVFGSVYQPGTYEYCEGDKLTTLLKIGQGTTKHANLKNVELTRLKEDWKNFETTIIDVSSILEGKSPDIELKIGDRLFIRDVERIFEPKEIQIKGEVLRPGFYPIQKGITKLSDVIKLSGGFTNYASLNEAKILLELDKEDYIKDPLYDILNKRKYARLNKEELEYFKLEEKLQKDYMFVSADFKKLFVEKDESSDILLNGNEIIIIPSSLNSVYVSGQIANTGYVSYLPEKDYEYYVKKAGGYSENADKGEIKIIKGRSKDWMNPGDTKIEVGDNIFIPKKPVRDFDSWWPIARDIASLVLSAGTLILLIIQVNNQK
jgi:protein involved in polysaccharide export with SLBB domain